MAEPNDLELAIASINAETPNWILIDDIVSRNQNDSTGDGSFVGKPGLWIRLRDCLNAQKMLRYRRRMFLMAVEGDKNHGGH